MILFTLLAMIITILVVLAIVILGITGVVGIITFGDLIVCVFIIWFIFKCIRRRNRKRLGR